MKNRRIRVLVSEVLYRLIETAVPFLVSVHVSRLLGAEILGLYAHSLNLVSYFSIIVSLGIQEYGIRCCAGCTAEEREQVMSEVFALQLLLGSAALAGCFLFLKASGYGQVIYYLQTVRIIAGMLDVSWMLKGTERFEYHAMVRMGTRLSGAVLIFLFARSCESYALLQAGILLGADLFLLISVRGFHMPSFRNVTGRAVPLLRIFLPSLAFQIFHMMDRSLLGRLAPMEELGLYSAADRYVHIPAGLMMSLCGLYMPEAVRRKHEKDGVFLSRTLEPMLYMGVFTACMCAGCASVFFPLFYGEAFVPCVRLSQHLSLILIIKACTGWYRTLCLIPREEYRTDIVSVCAGMAVNGAADLFLIPRYGADGAVMGTVVAELMILAVYLPGMKEAVRKLPEGTVMKVLLSGIISIWIMTVQKGNGAGLLCRKLVSGGICWIIAFCFCLKKESLLMMAGRRKEKNETE